MSFIFYFCLFLQFLIFKSASVFVWDDLRKSRLEKLIDEQRKLAKLHTVGIIITNSNGPIYQNFFSDENIENIQKSFLIGSVTKTFTALSFLKLENYEEIINQTLDKFELDDYLDEELLKDITVGELLNHTSGLDQFNSRRISQKGKFAYSNVGYSLLGKIIEKKSGKAYSKHLKDTIFDPLGMSNTRAEYNEGLIDSYTFFFGARSKYTSLKSAMNDRDGFDIPAGYISSTIEDMGKYLRFYLNESNIEVIKKMTICNVEEKDNLYYGIGLYIIKKNDNIIYYHSGNTPSFLSELYIIPELKFGFFIVTNTNDILLSEPYKHFITSVKNLLLYNAYEKSEDIDELLFFYVHLGIGLLCWILIIIPLIYLIFTIIKKLRRRKYSWFIGIKGKIIFGVDILVLFILPIILPIFAFGTDKYIKYICINSKDLFFTIIFDCALLFLILIIKIVYIILYIKFDWDNLNSEDIEKVDPLIEKW